MADTGLPPALSSVALSPPISWAAAHRPVSRAGPGHQGRGAPGLRTLPPLVGGGRTHPPSRRPHSRPSSQKAGLLDPRRVCPLPSRSPDHAPAPPKPLTPRSAAPPRRTRPPDSCKGFPLLVAAAACRQLVLNFDPDSFLILEYF